MIVEIIMADDDLRTTNKMHCMHSDDNEFRSSKALFWPCLQFAESSYIWEAGKNLQLGSNEEVTRVHQVTLIPCLHTKWANKEEAGFQAVQSSGFW